MDARIDGLRGGRTRLHVVRPWGYPARFNTPRQSRHIITTRRWLPLHRLWQPLEVALILMPGPRPDLIASFNRIPLGPTPFVISFESHLPRLFGHERSAAFRFFRNRLVQEGCRQIIPISQHARRLFLRQHRDSPDLALLSAKASEVIYPSVDLGPARRDEQTGGHGDLQAVFVGNHFSRKGGLAVLAAAEQALRQHLPIRFHIVSDLTVGGRNHVWTDPPDPDFFAADLARTGLANVTLHGPLPHAKVLALLRQSDVALLPTLCDTFGYFVLEALAAGLPVIATGAYALPEIIRPGQTGVLLQMQTDAKGEWIGLARRDKGSAAYGKLYRDTVQDLAEQMLKALERLLDDPANLARMGRAARADAAARFDGGRHAARLDQLYEDALRGQPVMGW